MEKPVIMNKPIFLNPGEDASMIYTNEAGRDVAVKYGYHVWPMKGYLLGKFGPVPLRSMREFLETAQFSWAKYIIPCTSWEDVSRSRKHLKELAARENTRNV